MYTESLRKNRARPSESAGQTGGIGWVNAIPNSAAYTLYQGTDEGTDSLPGLESRILARQPDANPRPQPQIPQAEAEADRLSASVSAASPEGVKADMGRRLGADFSGVHFHTGGAAQTKADAMGARAFTSGTDVYFGDGGFDPAIAAHELVHTVQQGAVDSGTSTLSTPLGGVQMWPFGKKKKVAAEPEIPDEAEVPQDTAGTEAAPDVGDTGETFGQASRRRLGNIAPLIGGGLRMVGRGIGWLGGKIKNAVVDKKDALVRQHYRAVDALNNNRQDYEDMSTWERFKWTVKNPLARMFASKQTEGTQKRNAHREEIEQAAADLRASALPGLGDAAYDPFSDPELMGARAEPDQSDASALPNAGGMVGSGMPEAQPVFAGKEIPDELATAQSLMGYGGKALSVGALATAPFTASRSVVDAALKGTKDLTKGQIDAGIASGALGGVRDTVGMINHSINSGNAWANGQFSDSIAHGLNAFGSGISAAANIQKAVGFGQAMSGGLSGVGAAQSLVPGAGIVAGGAQTLGGGIHMGSALMTRSKMKDRMEAMKERRDKGELTADEERLYRTFNQAKRMASVRAVGGGMDMAAGALKVTGNAMTLGGVTSLAGTVVSGAGSGVDIVKGLVTDKMKKTRRTDVVEEELGLEGKIQQLVDQGMSPKDAKHVVLKSMGFASGTRKEAFQHITMRRATDLYKQAERGDEKAKSILSDMGLHKFNGHYSLQGVAERLGMESGASWQSQMYDTAHSRDKNPFALAAEEHRKKKQRA